MKLIMYQLLKALMSFFTPISLLLQLFTTILKTEKEKIFNIRKLVEAITHEMDMANGALNKAEAKGRDDGTNKKVLELRNIVFKIEDVIDDYKLLLLEQKQYLGKHREDSYDNKKHRNNIIFVIIKKCFNGIWGTLTGIYKVLMWFKKKHGISCRIVNIRTAMEKMKGEKGYEETILSSLERATESENVEEQRAQEKKLNDPGVGPLYKDEKKLIGFKERKNAIIDKLDLGTNKVDKGQFVLAICGLPGVGKTTLARKVYEDENVRKHFSCYAWITATKPYKRVELLKSLSKQLVNSYAAVAQKEEGINPEKIEKDRKLAEEKVENLQENEVIMTDHLRSYLQQNHKDKKGYLVVFDDVSEKEELCDIVKAALVHNDNEGVRIIITTNSQRIANYWKTSFFHGDGETYHLRVMSRENAEELFNMKAFGTRGECPWKLKKLRNTIVQECDGLPLLIEKVGALFSTTKKWIDLYQQFQVKPLSESSKQVFLSIYHEMPSHLRPCFLYLSMFPKGKELDRMRIVRLWIAEGFVEAKDNSPEEAAEEYLNELVERGMIRYVERDETERNRTFRLPSIWYHIILPKLKDLEFCLVLQQNMSNIDNQHRRLSIHKEYADTIATNTLRVCSILSFVSSKTFPIPLPIPQTFFKLKVLDLQDANFVEVPKELGNLHNLKYLSFRDTIVKELPDTINGLWNLQTLDLKQTHIKALPSGIKSLNKLRYLLIGFKKNGLRPDPVQIPTGALSSFTELQKLTFVDGSSEPLLLDLGKLTQLKRLGVVNLDETHGENLCKAMANMTALRSLSINAVEEAQALNLTYTTKGEENTPSCPPEFLERLYLRGSLVIGLPKWIPKLRHLVKLLLRNSKLKEDPVPMLQVMQELLVLELDNAYDGKELNFKRFAFRNLRVLRIKNSQYLRRMKAENGCLPRLRKVEFEDCPNLNNLPWMGDDSVVMQELLVLQLNNAYNGKELFFGPPGFQKLQELYVKNLPNCERINIRKNDLPRLQKKEYDQDRVKS